jgi:myo-inositol-1-phosphate synthase
MSEDRSRTGIWLVGGRGSVATTVVAGTAALRAGLAEPVGCVTEQPDFPRAGLPALPDLVFDGQDVACTPLPKRGEQLVAAGVLPHGLPALVHDDLAAADAEIHPAPLPGRNMSQSDAVEAIRADITGFRERHGLARMVVVNVSSTEPVLQAHPAHDSAGALRAALDAGENVLPTAPCTPWPRSRPGARTSTSRRPPACGSRRCKTGRARRPAVLRKRRQDRGDPALR